MKSVTGTFSSLDEARDAVQKLEAAGFGSDAIGLAIRDPESLQFDRLADPDTANAVDAATTKVATGAVSGAGLGALLGLTLVGSTILVPGLGPVLLAGPIAAALTGASLGMVSGTLITALVEFGVPESEATSVADRIKKGEVLVGVLAESSEIARAEKILRPPVTPDAAPVPATA